MRVLLICACALVCVYARTTTRQQSISAHITSLNDKDIKRKAMEHPAFANAGRTPGTEIWRIEDFEPVPVPPKDFGKFYKGDSYIILKTKADKKGNLSWDIHYWLGSATSQDEAGAAAILTVGLDDKFGGAPVQHRETLGHESPQFLGYFQPAIRYLDGGHASGFSHVTTNAGAEKRLFQVKGKRNVRVRQVNPTIAAMNKGDCFILDVNHDIYVYVGEKAKNVEKLKAISVANQIKDQDHNGRGKVEIIDQYSNEADVEKFFTALGSGSRAAVPDESAGGDDQAFERSEEQTVSLSEISDSSGSLKVTPLPKPYKQEQLKPQECYILDTVTGGIYVWVGKQSTEREKTEAMNKAQQYLASKNYPSWVHVTRIPQGTEPAAFKQYFSTWRDVGMTHSRLIRSASDEEFYASDEEVSTKRAKIISKTGAARGFMPDDGTGHFTVYRIEKMQLVKTYDSATPGSDPGKKHGEFFQGDSYVIDYEYNKGGVKNHIIYYWLGKDSSLDEKAAAATNSVALDKRGAATLVRVPQGEEPRHFLKIFKGRLITVLGGIGSGFRNANEKDSYDTDGVRLFKVYGTAIGEDMRCEQVPEKASSLTPDDVYILETPQKVYIWEGNDSSPDEQTEAPVFAKLLGINTEKIIVKQGKEPAEFWTFLEGNADHVKAAGEWKNKLGSRVGVEPRLFEVTFQQNKEQFEETPNFEQNDLEPDEVNVLDTGDELYVWIGSEVEDQTRKLATSLNLAGNYLHGSGNYFNPRVLVVVKQGLEPKAFKDLFEHWSDDLWKKNKTHSKSAENNEV